MPHERVVKALEDACKRRTLPPEVTRKILAWIQQAETGDFNNKDSDQQLGLILDALPNATTENQKS